MGDILNAFNTEKNTHGKADEYNFDKNINELKIAMISGADMTAIEQLVRVLACVPTEKLNLVDGIINAVECKTCINQDDVTHMKNFYSNSDMTLNIKAEDCTKRSQTEKIRIYHTEYKFYNELYKPFLKVKYLISVAEYSEAAEILAQFK